VTRQLSLEREEEMHSKLEDSLHQLDEVVSSKKRHVHYIILKLASYPGLLIPAFVACSINVWWTLDGCLQEWYKTASC